MRCYSDPNNTPITKETPVNKHYDFVIVGSGSAGGVLAARLSEDPDIRVLVLEAGGEDRSIMIHMPAAFSYPLGNDRYNWAYYCEPDPHMNNRRVYCPRGRVIGGSSSINGMVYIRGNALDYDGWQSAGAEGWAEVLERAVEGGEVPGEVRAAVADRHSVSRLAANVAALYEELTGA